MTAFSCDRASLAWALRAVLPHASRDDALPSLCAVRLELAGGELFLTACDRYTIGCARIPAEGDPGPATASLTVPDARGMLRRARGKGDADLAIWDDGEISLDWRIRYPAGPGGLDPWRKLLATILRYPAGTPRSDGGYDPEFLARFRPADQDRAGLTFMPVRHGRSNLTVVLGECFAGAVMGRRMVYSSLPSAPQNLARWRELLPKEQS